MLLKHQEKVLYPLQMQCVNDASMAQNSTQNERNITQNIEDTATDFFTYNQYMIKLHLTHFAFVLQDVIYVLYDIIEWYTTRI